MTRQRLDEALVARGLYQTRSRARDAILRGTVMVNGAPARRPAQSLGAGDDVRIQDPGQDYVSRAALKLLHALDHFKMDVRGKTCLDLGASTGGFCQVLLERGAARVYAIDVGHGQMAISDPRLRVIEGLNARDVTKEHVPETVNFLTCDVSFISLLLALPPALSLAERGAGLVALIKPQFEVGRQALGKGGIVSDEAAKQEACQRISAFLEGAGWKVLGLATSPIAGGDGNEEFLIAAEKAS